MASYWVVSLCLLNPTLVTGPGRYLTRGGAVVTVDSVEGFKAFGLYENGPSEWWTVCGRTLPSYESPNDIVGRA
jgi:hypothetical protein